MKEQRLKYQQGLNLQTLHMKEQVMVKVNLNKEVEKKYYQLNTHLIL